MKAGVIMRCLLKSVRLENNPLSCNIIENKQTHILAKHLTILALLPRLSSAVFRELGTTGVRELGIKEA